jgi:hypothetical protein
LYCIARTIKSKELTNKPPLFPQLYEENNGKISGPAYFGEKSTEKLNLPSVLSSDLEILRLRISKGDDAGEFSTLRRMLKENWRRQSLKRWRSCGFSLSVVVSSGVW